MQKQRLVYRVMLKVMSLIAVLILLAVFINSLFSASPDEPATKNQMATIELAGMAVGDIRKTRWQGREVAVLKRAKQKPSDKIGKMRRLNPQTRSILPGYFVYFNTGDSGNCPLFFNGKTFKDVCSGKYFDTKGRGQNPEGSMMIEVPPHHFVSHNGVPGQLVIGSWETD